MADATEAAHLLAAIEDQGALVRAMKQKTGEKPTAEIAELLALKAKYTELTGQPVPGQSHASYHAMPFPGVGALRSSIAGTRGTNGIQRVDLGSLALFQASLSSRRTGRRRVRALGTAPVCALYLHSAPTLLYNDVLLAGLLF